MIYNIYFWFFAATCLTPNSLQQKLVAYWGQNGGKSELSLEEYCDRSAYDIIIIGFVHNFFDAESKNYPIINLSKHCGYSPNTQYKNLVKCDVSVINAIKTCHANKKKVQIALGGGSSTYNLPNNATQVKLLAKRIWNLYLGGKEDVMLRPFGATILDGVNFDIEHGNTNDGYPMLIKELRSLMASDSSRRYYITAAPQCPYPDTMLKTSLSQQGHLFDALYIQYYNNPCYYGGGTFAPNFKKWINQVKEINKKKTNGALIIFIGLPAHPKVTIDPKYYKTVQQVKKLYDNVKEYEELGGFMLWDAGWDEKSKSNGKRYSDLVKHLFSVEHNVVMAWGQNGVSNAGDGNEEASLDVYCSEKHYDAFSIFLMYNTDDVISMDMSKHCGFKYPGTDIVRCEKTVADQMKSCQQKGKKIFITLGNVQHDMKITSSLKAEQLATNIWNMMFAGSSNYRPFHDVVLDGITIYLKDGTTSTNHWKHFIQQLRSKMNADNKKSYTLTIMTSCLFPNNKFGALFTSIQPYVDSIYVYSDGASCDSSTSGIKNNLKQWLTIRGNSTRPDVYLGLPASSKASGHVYLTPSALNSTYQQELKNMHGFAGFFLWDAGWDNHTNGKKYSDYIGQMIAWSKSHVPSTDITTTTKATTTTKKTTPPTTKSTTTPRTTTTSTTTKPTATTTTTTSTATTTISTTTKPTTTTTTTTSTTTSTTTTTPIMTKPTTTTTTTKPTTTSTTTTTPTTTTTKPTTTKPITTSTTTTTTTEALTNSTMATSPPTSTRTTANSTTAASTTTATPTSKPFTLVGHWGQNLAHTRHSEASLASYCERNSYDVIILNALHIFYDDNNQDKFPGLTFSKHCSTPYGNGYKTYLKCDNIARDIKACQQRGKKVILSIGNFGRWNGFATKNDAKAYGLIIWNLFLGGSELRRTFGSEILDGINIEISYGYVRDWFSEFVEELRRLTNTDSRRDYMITTTTPCSFPNFQLGETYTKSSMLFDSFFVSFVDSCTILNEPAFSQSLAQWLTLPGPNIYIGIPSNKDIRNLGKFYVKESKVAALYKKFSELHPRFAGVVLDDVSWDDVNIQNGIRYSDRIAKVLKPEAYTTKITTTKITRKNPDQSEGTKITTSHAVILMTLVVYVIA